MNRLLLLYFFCLLSVNSLLAHGYELTLDGLKASLQDFSLKDNFNVAYDSALQYRDYLRYKVEQVTINELDKTGGKRLPILCSTDDYVYYIIHYLPSPLKTYVLDRYDQQYHTHHHHHHRYSSSEERNEQFYLTIKGLPPTIKDKAMVAKDELEDYLSTTPNIGLYNTIEEYSLKWDTFIESDIKDRLKLTKKELDTRLTSHRLALQEYIDQGMVVRELFGNPESVEQDQLYSHETINQQWMGNTKRLDNLIINEQKEVKAWYHKVELGFLDAVTTLGPLRRLAEEMFDDAMNKTMESLLVLESKQIQGLGEWNNLSLSYLEELNGHIASLPLTTTLDALDNVKKNVDDIFNQCLNLLDGIKVYDDSKKAILSIGNIWYQARQELTYSRWQWKYWVNLWNDEGLHAVFHLFTSLNQ